MWLLEFKNWFLFKSGAQNQIIQQTINMTTTVASPQQTPDLVIAGALLQGQQGIRERVAQGKPLKGTLDAIACLAETCMPQARVAILYYDPGDDQLSDGGFGKLPQSVQLLTDKTHGRGAFPEASGR